MIIDQEAMRREAFKQLAIGAKARAERSLAAPWIWDSTRHVLTYDVPALADAVLTLITEREDVNTRLGELLLEVRETRQLIEAVCEQRKLTP